MFQIIFRTHYISDSSVAGSAPRSFSPAVHPYGDSGGSRGSFCTLKCYDQTEAHHTNTAKSAKLPEPEASAVLTGVRWYHNRFHVKKYNALRQGCSEVDMGSSNHKCEIMAKWLAAALLPVLAAGLCGTDVSCQHDPRTYVQPG